MNSVLDPHCPACSKEWSYDFLTANLPKLWLLKEYKKHREAVLLDREKSLLPETQEAAAAVVRERKVKEFRTERYLQLLQAKRLRREATAHLKNLARPSLKTDPAVLETAREACRTQRALIISLDRQLDLVHRGRINLETGEEIPDSTSLAVQPPLPDVVRREFIHPCPAEGCRGFLSTGWKCKLCSAKACSKCGDPLPEDDEHECNPDTRASFEAVRRESKPCPKCAAPISKISGCDHMFCVACKTAFSWRTGEIHPTGNSNPYYWQWRQSRDPQAGPANVECAATPEARIQEVLHRIELLQRQEPPSYYQFNLGMAQSIRHIHYYLLRRYRFTANSNQHLGLRIKYLLNEITEDQWRINIQRVEKQQRKARFIANILELFVNATVDILEPIILPVQITTAITQIEELRSVCNSELSKIPVIFGSTEYEINATFDLQARK